VQLSPWSPIQRWTFEGDPVEAKLRDQLFPELHKGSRAGSLRLQAMRLRAEQKLKEAGHPEAKVGLSRTAETGGLRIHVNLGRPTLIERVEWDGDSAPYPQDRLLDLAGIRPGRSLWTQSLRREAMAGLRKRFLADRRYEWQAEFSWKPDGVLHLRISPGPRVQIAFAGDRIRWTGVKDLLPFVWADRWSPDLLEQGDRRILLYLNNAGYKDAQVSHRREVLPGGGEARVTYTVTKGAKAAIDELVFERNREIASAELSKAAQLPRGSLGLGSPSATPDLVDATVERVKAHYLRSGFTEVSLRRRLETQAGRTRLVIQVREGERRFIESLVLQVPAAAPWNSPGMAEALFTILGERHAPVDPPGPIARRSERPELGGAVGVLTELAADPGAPTRRWKLSLNRPIPLVKTDLAMVLNSLRQRVARLGTPRPLFPKLSREEGERGERILVEVQEQPLFQVRRLAVQGSDETRPEAVLREAGLAPGAPLDPASLIHTQARVGNLGAFDRVELLPLAESPHPEPRPDWREGDLLLRLQERPHWVFSSGFGYDRISGYHFGLGAQRLNFQGLGRTLDFNARAGDATLQNPGLRNFFSTGAFRRSVDIYSIGYSDPWFAPGKIASWLPDRTEYRAEGAYLDEVQSSFEIRRRRVLNGLQWKPIPGTEVRLGHRFERVEVNSIIHGLSNDELNALTRTPGRVVISAPYLQYTRDRRDNPFDPTTGAYFYGKLELANQLWGTSKNASFVKLDLRYQWNWPIGYRAEWGVVSVGTRVGVARPTASSSEDLPLSERFFAGGPGSNRGVEPDFLGPITSVPLRDPATGEVLVRNGYRQYYLVPQGGQGLALLNLEYRFPITPSWWLEVFLDSSQVYASLNPPAGADTPFPPLRTSLGVGVILKLGIPLKIEYGADVRRIFARPRSNIDRQTQLKNLLISAGFQF
jgi:outer membrane protein assembly factor BamA